MDNSLDNSFLACSDVILGYETRNSKQKMKYKIAVEFAPRKNFQGVNVRIEKTMDLDSDLEAAIEVRKLTPIVQEEAKSALNAVLWDKK